MKSHRQSELSLSAKLIFQGLIITLLIPGKTNFPSLFSINHSGTSGRLSLTALAWTKGNLVMTLDTRASLSSRNQDRHDPVSSTNQCDDWLDYSLLQTFHDSRALRTVWYWQRAWQILSDWHLFYRHFPVPPLTKTMSGCAIWHHSIWPSADSQPWKGHNL